MPHSPAQGRKRTRASIDDRTRLLADLPGHYYLEKWRSETGRSVNCFACRILRISPLKMTLSAPVGGEYGDKVVSHFDEFGMLRGTISRPLGFGFVVALRLSAAEQSRLAARVNWLEQRRNNEVADNRAHKRVVPRNPQSSLILADARKIVCFVIDMSPTGAAVSADIVPDIGTPLALGSAVGRVVRHLNPGFAMRFVEPIAPDELEDRLIRSASDFHYV